MLAIIISVVVVTIDQLSKLWAYNTLQGTKGIQVIGELLEFRYVENRGAAFGILEGRMWFFYIITIIVVTMLFYYLFTQGKDSLFLNITVGLLIGGTLGNFIDRLLRGFVVDFIKVDLVSQINFPVFNVADIAITIGSALFIIYILFIEQENGDSGRIKK